MVSEPNDLRAEYKLSLANAQPAFVFEVAQQAGNRDASRADNGGELVVGQAQLYPYAAGLHMAKVLSELDQQAAQAVSHQAFARDCQPSFALMQAADDLRENACHQRWRRFDFTDRQGQYVRIG